ncbi:MAG: hypothetical protein OER86_11260, partial [Phycisphaerae bacterium]|nr:hypothetical protein [Phycisphaerae bacterium]
APVTTEPPKPAAPSRVELIDQLAGKIRRDAEGRDDLRQYLAEAALSVLDPSRRLDEQDLQKLSPADRRLVGSYQEAFRQLALNLEDDRGQQRRQLQEAARRLAEEIAPAPGLRIGKSQLCTQVRGFGVFKKFASNSFLAGRRQPVIVYTELENFTSRVDSKDEHVVRLTQEIVLYNESDGLAVWRIKPSQIIDRSHTRRRDFFVVNKTYLPERLTVGKYRLKVTMTDTQDQSVDEATIPIRIVADAALVNGK